MGNWHMNVEQPAEALQIGDRLVHSAAKWAPDQAVPRISELRGASLAALGRSAEGEAEFRAGIETARSYGMLPTLRRLQASLGNLYRVTGRPADSDSQFGAARAIVDQLAANVPDPVLRRSFVSQVAARM